MAVTRPDHQSRFQTEWTLDELLDLVAQVARDLHPGDPPRLSIGEFDRRVDRPGEAEPLPRPPWRFPADTLPGVPGPTSRLPIHTREQCVLALRVLDLTLPATQPRNQKAIRAMAVATDWPSPTQFNHHGGIQAVRDEALRANAAALAAGATRADLAGELTRRFDHLYAQSLHQMFEAPVVELDLAALVAHLAGAPAQVGFELLTPEQDHAYDQRVRADRAAGDRTSGSPRLGRRADSRGAHPLRKQKIRLSVLVDAGLIEPDETLYGSYRKRGSDTTQNWTATFRSDREITVTGVGAFSSLSAAATAITGQSWNGGEFWEVERDGQRTKIARLRDQWEAEMGADEASAPSRG